MSTNRIIDIFDLVRREQALEGSFSLDCFSRLVAGLPQQLPEALVTWAIKGRQTPAHESFIDLEASALLVLECQRCMQPFQWPVQVRDTLQLVASESKLRQDEVLVDEVEQVVGSRHFDLLELLEDELILCVPYAPVHEQCPSGAPVNEFSWLDDDSPRPNPFAVLGKLKKN